MLGPLTPAHTPRVRATTVASPAEKKWTDWDRRDWFEKAGGVLGGVGQVAASLIPAVIIGTREGLSRANNPEHKVDAARVARDLTIGTAVQALVPSAAIGFWSSGWKGASVALSGQITGSATGLALFSKGGAADHIGEGMAQDLERALSEVESKGDGAWKGAKAGFFSGMRHNYAAGRLEGEGFFSGLVEGSKAAPKAFKSEVKVTRKGSWLAKLGQTVAGVAGAVLAAPAGMTQGIVKTLSGADLSPTRRAAYTAGGLALFAGWNSPGVWTPYPGRRRRWPGCRGRCRQQLLPGRLSHRIDQRASRTGPARQ